MPEKSGTEEALFLFVCPVADAACGPAAGLATTLCERPWAGRAAGAVCCPDAGLATALFELPLACRAAGTVTCPNAGLATAANVSNTSRKGGLELSESLREGRHECGAQFGQCGRG